MNHVRYAANAYWFVALACAAIAFFIIIQYLIRFISEIYKLHSGGGKRAIERMRNLKRVEPPEPEPVSPDLPLQVSAEVQPILEYAEPPKPEPVSLDVPLRVSAEAQPILEHTESPEPEPAVNLDVSLQVSAEVQPILEHAEPPEPEPAVSPDLPLQVSAEVQPILEHAEPPEPEPAVSPDLPLQVSAEVQPILEYAEPPKPEPVSLDVPLQVSAEAQPILEHAEPPEPEPAVSLDVPLQVSAEVQPILEYAEPPEPEPAVSLDVPLQVSAEAQPILEHAEPPEPEPAVSPDLPLQVSAEVQPILEYAEPPKPEPVSPDVPLQVSAEAQPILEHAEPPEPEPAVSLDVPLQVSAEVQPILEHAEPFEPEPAVSGNVYTAQKDYDRAIANYDEAIKFDPKFAVAYEEISPEDKSAVKEARPFKGSIGVTIRRVTDGAAHALNVTPARGALVVAIDENGPAEAAGIEPADVIVKVDGKDVKECRDLPRIVADTTAGKDVALTIIRKGKELTKTVKVGRLEDGSAPQEEPVAVDPKSEAAAKHPAPGMAIFEIQQQPVSSDPLLLVLPVPPRFGRRRFDHVSKVSH